jgi:hypothetical protein
MMSKIPFAPDILEMGAATYRERNKTYGDSYKQFGHVMQALFPDGMHITTEEDWNRAGILVMIIGKITRMSPSLFRQPHIDSIHDIMVYAAMLEEICTPEQE